MIAIACTTLFIVSGALAQGAPMADARAIVLETAAPIVEIDTGKLKGELAMLAWSPGGDEFYLQTAERDRRGAVVSTGHYLVTAKGVKSIDQQPPWATAYWAWK